MRTATGSTCSFDPTGIAAGSPPGPHQRCPSDLGLGPWHLVGSPMSVARRADRTIIRVGDGPRIVDARTSLPFFKGVGYRVGNRGLAFELEDLWGPGADAVVRGVRREKLPARIDVTGFQDCCSRAWSRRRLGVAPVSAA